MSNPFEGWTEEMQCKHTNARDTNGNGVLYDSVAAVQWCAYGRLDKADVPFWVQSAFCEWLKEQHGSRVSVLNDKREWTPAQFAEAWDRFEASR